MTIRKLLMNINNVDWIHSSRDIFMNTTYENIFDFALSNEKERCIIEVSNIYVSDLKQVDILLTRDNLISDINMLIEYYSLVEDFEKCERLNKLKNNIKYE